MKITRPFRIAVLFALATAAPLPAQEAGVETRVQVRVLARDAKLIGDKVGGARVTVTVPTTGEVLATGLTTGETGDTDLIMRTPRERGVDVFDTPGAAGYLATFALREPTEVEIAAIGPLGYPQATAHASKRLVLAPGARIEGNGVVLELNGLIVEILEPAKAVAGPELPVRARVQMLCSCPTEPEGLWSVERVTARLLADDEVVAEAPLSFAGEASVYAGTLEPPGPGDYRLAVLAADPGTGNFGTAERAIAVP